VKKFEQVPLDCEGQSPIKSAAEPPGGTIYQLKIVLLEVEPAIWRRIQTRDCTLDTLHDVLQVVMGWKSGGEYRFDLRGQEFGDPDMLGDDFRTCDMRDARRTRLSQVMVQDDQACPLVYEYDLAEGWRHAIAWEGTSTPQPNAVYPTCLEGERACPPTRRGGAAAYQAYLAALPHAGSGDSHTSANRPGTFDPTRFDLRQVQRLLHSCMLRQ